MGLVERLLPQPRRSGAHHLRAAGLAARTAVGNATAAPGAGGRARPADKAGSRRVGRRRMTTPTTAPEPGHLSAGEVQAVTTARGLTPDDVSIRLRADVSSGPVVLFIYGIALVWLIIGSLFGELASVKLHWPDLLNQQAWL